MNHEPVYRTAPATPGVLNIRSSFHGLAAQNIAFGHIMSHGVLIEFGEGIFFSKKRLYTVVQRRKKCFKSYIL